MTFTSNAAIACGDMQYEGLDVIVDGATLTVDCQHQFRSLTLVNGARLEHTAEQLTGFEITIAQDLTIDAQSRVDVSARGYARAEGPGAGTPPTLGTAASGAAHGGRGGISSIGAESGLPYGSILNPTTPGSGGGDLGGAGGGVARFIVSGTALIDGFVIADGQGVGRGGGAGGAIVIQASTITGGGGIYARGGAGNNNVGDGGGGGGRVVVRAGSFGLAGEVVAFGGDGWQDGGAGTVVFDIGTPSFPELVLDNAERSSSGDTDFVGPVVFNGDVTVRGRARLSAPSGASLDLRVTGDLAIESTGVISMQNEGFRSGQGPGAGTPSGFPSGNPSGGSHGGSGGTSNTGDRAGTTYGSFAQPTTAGSGGGGGTVGGAGGGAMHLVVDGTLINDGLITVDGQDINGGGGAAGSVWIEAGTYAGGGGLYAEGGNGNNNVGYSAGGGGRVAIESDQYTFNGEFRISGGDGWQDGGPGSLYLLDRPTGDSQLIFDNRGRPTAAVSEIAGTLNVPGDLLIRGSADVGPARGVPGSWIIGGDLIVEPTGDVYGIGHGFSSNTGPGAGSFPGLGSGSGGSHGGVGGASSTGAPAARPYGQIFGPNTLGSGGGYLSGGAGGGAIRIEVLGDAIVDGRIVMNGANGGGASGGGSGGSLWLVCDQLLGGGAIEARGAAGPSNSGGSGGGGGRIHIDATSVGLAGSISARGSTGWRNSGAGTVLIEEAAGPSRELIIDNGGISATNEGTALVEPLSFDGSLVIRNLGVLRAWFQEELIVSVTQNIVVEPNGWILADGRGFPRNQGPGAGGLAGAGTGSGSGGGFGGLGGQSSAGNVGGLVYGDRLNPVDFGSGGGFLGGGAGGGVIQLVVGGDALIDGVIRSNGDNGGSASGGGSGGSILITCDTLRGQGLIESRGGAGNTNGGGSGGGGGRIAIYTSCDPEFDIGVLRAPGGSGWRSGEEGTIYQGSATPTTGDIVLSSSAPGTGLALTAGTLIQDVFTLNNGVPAFSAAWSPVLRASDRHGRAEFRCLPLGIIEIFGEMTELASASTGGDLRTGALESSTAIYVIPESLGQVLSLPITVDAAVPGTYNETSDLSPTSLSAGSRVACHLLHFDSNGTTETFLSGSVVFDADIVGVIVDSGNLDTSDSAFALSGVSYPVGEVRRGLDFFDATDSIVIGDDLRTLTFNGRVVSVLDQVRVITEIPDAASKSFVDSLTYLDQADEVTIDGCSSGFYRFTFDLPAGAQNIELEGLCNASPQGIVYLNGMPISGVMTAPQCEPDLDLGPIQPCFDEVDAEFDRIDANGRRILTAPTADCFGAYSDSLFVTGTNELVFAVCASASYWQPTGLEFRAVVNFD